MDDAIPAVGMLGAAAVSRLIENEKLPFSGVIKRRARHFYTGWHLTITASAGLTFCVLIINIALLNWGVSKSLNKSDPNVYDIYHGQCSDMRNIFFYSHLVINILSTILLATSTSSCQIIISPTRREVDAAHKKGVWLDIGVPSFTNLQFIARKRAFIYFLLCASSIPLHLIYNSVIFPTNVTNESATALVTPVAINGDAFNHLEVWLASDFNFVEPLHGSINPYYSILKHMQKKVQAPLHGQTGDIARLDNFACVQQFSRTFIDNYSHFFVVTKSLPELWHNITILQWTVKRSIVDRAEADIDLSWWCGIRGGLYYECDVSDPLESGVWKMTPNWKQTYATRTSGWKPHIPVEIDYCFAEMVDTECKISLDYPLLIAVIACNLIKLVCFLVVVDWSDESSLVLIGDAIASFLRKPDKSTIDCGPLSARDVYKDFWGRRKPRDVATCRAWRPKRRFWFKASRPIRWVLAVGVAIYILIASITFICASIKRYGFESLSSIGTINIKQVVDFTLRNSITGNILFVNFPQVVIAVCYVSFETLLTSCLQTSEFCTFAKQRKPLRVSSPSELQNSTYWLQIPFVYAIPNLAAWTVLHWIAAQSLFLLRIETFKYLPGEAPQKVPINSVTGAGYSPTAFLLVVCIGGAIVLVTIALGLRQLPANIPIVGSCTAAIAAACHACEGESEIDDMALQPLKYGVLRNAIGAPIKTEAGQRRRVGLSAREVDTLVEGEVYS